MKYFKIPLEADLSQTSYRAYKATEEAAYIEYNEGVINSDWKELSLEELIAIFNNNPFEVIIQEETPVQPSEQELIQAEILLNQAKILAKLNQLGV